MGLVTLVEFAVGFCCDLCPGGYAGLVVVLVIFFVFWFGVPTVVQFSLCVAGLELLAFCGLIISEVVLIVLLICIMVVVCI